MITDMVKAHLENVRSLINDLHEQKLKIDQEIQKLTTYLEKGTSELTVYQNSLSTNRVDSSNVSQKHYLGEE